MNVWFSLWETPLLKKPLRTFFFGVMVLSKTYVCPIQKNPYVMPPKGRKAHQLSFPQVTRLPVAHLDYFSSAIVHATQCRADVKLYFQDSQLSRFIGDNITAAVLEAANEPGTAPNERLVAWLACDEPKATPFYATFAQLKPCEDPPDAFADDATFQTLVLVGKPFVLYDNVWYAVVPTQYWKNNIQYFAKLNDSTGVRISTGKRHTSHLYAEGQTTQENVINVAIGIFDDVTHDFVMTHMVKLSFTASVCTPHLKRLFNYREWPLDSADPAPASPVAAYADEPVHGAAEGINAIFSTIDEKSGKLAMCFSKGSEDEQVLVKVCDFELKAVVARYMPMEDDPLVSSMFKLLCRRGPFEGGSGTFLLPRSTNDRNIPPGYEYHDIEVFVIPGDLTNHTTVCASFLKGHVELLCICMKPEQLLYWMSFYCATNDVPTLLFVVRFGRQLDDSFVTSNIRFKDGILESLDASKLAILPDVFNRYDFPSDKWPKTIVIPQDYVRYNIGYNFWNRFSCYTHLNNQFVARTVFAHAVAGMFTSKFVNGEAGVVTKQFPFAWLYSPIHYPNTGKTTAMIESSSVSGFGYPGRGLLSADATKAGLWDRTHIMRDAPIAYDDFVMDPKGDKAHGLSEVGRALYDATTRTVCGKTRQILSSAMFTVRAPRHAPRAAL